jgi:diadenosine tetraphosphate (Ap4A) HIT family hydrolase
MTSLPEPNIQLAPQLARDCIELGRFSLCRLLLMNDANYPWFILVPMREGVREIHELFEADQQQLLRESSLVSRMLVDEFRADKVNIAALGNVVPQLHIHHIARYHDDPAWPAPVWGRHEAKPYPDNALQELVTKVQQALGSGFRVLNA